MGEFDYTYEERQRDVNAGLYVPFYIETPVEDLTVSISAETGEVITATCQVVDPGGDDIEERMKVRMILFTDGNYDTVSAAMTSVTVAASTGLVLFENTADADIDFTTDDLGALVITFTDAAAGTETAWLGFILPNGKFVEGGQVGPFAT
jgi:hypothetical protein